MEFGKSQIVDIPSLPIENYDPGNQFQKQVGDLFKLANSNSLTAFKGQSGTLDLKSIESNPNLSSDEKYKLTEELFKTPYQNKTITPTSVSLTELDPYMKSRDFKNLGYKPFADNYQRYYDNRGLGNTSWKIFNKFLVSAEVGAASAFTPIGTGLGYLTGTDYGKQWSDKLAAWQEVKNDYNQIYYSDSENQASGMNPFKTPTKFFDNLLPSLGFTVGNMAASYFTMRLGGGALMKGFGAVAKESELFRTLQRSKLGMYRGMKGMDALAGEKGLVAGAEATVQNISRTTKVLQGLKTGAGNVAKILPYSFYSAAGEGHIEASMAKHEFYYNWYEDYKQKHGGALPSAEEQLKRTALAEQVYDETLKYNTIVLFLTNTLEIGALVKKMGLTGELLKRTGLGRISKAFDVDDIAFRGFNKGWEKKTTKELLLPYTIASAVDALGESFEEASQYAISRGVQTWATQKFNDPNAVSLKKDWIEKITGFETDSFNFIASMDNVDDEMKSNAWFGFLSGALMSGGTKAIINPIKNRNAPDVAQKRIDLLNKNKDFLSLKFIEANENKVNNYTQNATILKEAIKNGDIFSLKNMEFADLYTWAANSIAAGGFDLRIEQLLDLKKLSKEDFESFFNLEYNEETKNDVNSYIDKVIKEGKEISKDIEQFRNTDNIFTFHEKPIEELTKEEKEENENFELFENVKYEMAYSYSRLKNFNKRNSKILNGLETAIGGTQTFSNLKRILFSENGILEYKNILQDEIKSLQADLKNLGTDSIFKEDFNKKQKEIKEKESILDSLNASKEDIDKWIEESKDILTDNQKQNLLSLTRRGLDKSNLKTILKYEIGKLQKEGIELQLGDNKVLSVEEMMSAIETPIIDIYNINSSKGIVLNKFNKLSTIKGAKKFIIEYKELQDRFENGTIKKDTYDDEFRKSLEENGYPKETNAIGVTLTYFTQSLDTVEENQRQLDRLNESNEFAINLIKEIKFKPKADEEKEETNFVTEFIFASKTIKLSSKTKDDLLIKIEKVKENLKQQKYEKEVSGEYIIKRTLRSFKNKEGKWVSNPSYEILTKKGDPAFPSNKKFTGKELFDFLKGIDSLSNTNIRKFEIIPFTEFENIQKAMTSSLVSKKKLNNLNIRFSIIEDRRILLEKQLNNLKNTESGNEMLNSPLRDLLNSNYLVIYELELELQRLLKLSKINKSIIDDLNAKYKAERGNKANWLNTKDGKRWKSEYAEIQKDIKGIQLKILENKENLEVFNKENEELFSFYNTINEIQLELNSILNEKNILKVYGDKLVTNLKELYDGTTTEYVTFTNELNELKNNLFEYLDEEQIKNLTEEFEIINEKHEKLRTLKNQYQNLINIHEDTLKIHQKEIDRIQSIIDELEEEIQYNSEEGANETIAFINNLKPSLIGLDTEIQKINSDIEMLKQKVSEIDTVISKSNSSLLEDYLKIKSIQEVFIAINRASLYKENLIVNKNISDFTNGDYHGQRKSIIKKGNEIILEFDPIDKEDASKMKPDFIYQLTSQDITANISPEKVLSMTKEEIDKFPNIEFHRFLSEYTTDEVRELFEILIVTPASIKESNPELYAHLENQFSDKRDMSETTDLFSVIIDKNTKKIIKKNNKFLTSSFYKAENKFKTNAEGLPLHVTEKVVLSDFVQFSEQYEKDIEQKTKEEIEEYLKDKDTLKKAIAFSKERYEDEIESMLDSINSGKFLISEIKDVTSGIFLWGEAKDVAKVMGITSDNVNNFAIGIVLKKEGGSLTYLDNDGKKQEIGQNLNAGTTAIINKSTGEWIPFVHKKQDDKSIDNILGILNYITTEHQKTGKSILELGKTSVPYKDGEYQLLWNTDRNYEISVDKIPLFPTLFNPKKEGRTVVLGELSKTYGARWSVITTLMNFGKDNVNPKNTIYFDEYNKLHFYDFNSKSIIIIDANTLNTILNSYQNGKIDELTNEEKIKLTALVQNIQQKYKNISYHYALSTKSRTKNGNKFLFKLPQYNAKTGKIEFKTFNSYLEYVIGLGTSNSGIVQTKIEKVDNRTSFQKSIILDTDLNNRLYTTEISEISKEYLDITKVEAKEETEEEAPKTSIEVKKTPIVNIEDLTINENIADIDENSEDTLFAISNVEDRILLFYPSDLEDGVDFKGKAISLNKLNSTNKGKELAKDLEKAIDKLKNTTDPFEKDINRVLLKYQFHYIYKKLYNIDLQTSQPKAVFDIPNGSIIEIKNLGEYKVVDELNFFAGNTIVLKNEENKHILLTKELLEQGLKENKIKVTKVITDITPKQQTQPTTEVETNLPIQRVLVPLNNLITDFEPNVQKLFSEPTIELYDEVIGNYEFDLSADITEEQKVDIQSKLDDVKKSFIISNLEQPTSTNQSEIDKKADIEIGKVGNTEYEVKVDGVYYQGKKLNNPENKTHRQLIEADIERRRQEELKNNGFEIRKDYKSSISGEEHFYVKNKNTGQIGFKEKGFTPEGSNDFLITIQLENGKPIYVSSLQDWEKTDYKVPVLNDKLLRQSFRVKYPTSLTDEYKIDNKNASEVLKEINAKYDAELTALESKPKINLEAKKAEIDGFIKKFTEVGSSANYFPFLRYLDNRYGLKGTEYDEWDKQATKEYFINLINAKYDAEQQQPISPSGEKGKAEQQPIQEKKIKTKEELWKELVDLGYDSFDSLDDYESFNKSFGMKGTTEENLIQDIENSKAEEKDSFIDLTLNKIIKENNITKNC
jgi:hypothetical protein